MDDLAKVDEWIEANLDGDEVIIISLKHTSGGAEIELLDYGRDEASRARARRLVNAAYEAVRQQLDIEYGGK